MRLTDALRAEHVVFHTLFDSLDQTADSLQHVAQVHTAARLLEAVLNGHGRAEDQLLLPVVEPLLSEIGHLENFHDEHDAIEKGLRHILTLHDVDSAKQALQKVVQIAREHFDVEERVVFPLAEERLTPASLEKLGTEWTKINQG